MKKQINLENIEMMIWSEAVEKFEEIEENGEKCFMNCNKETFIEYIKNLIWREVAYIGDTLEAELKAECEDIIFRKE